MKLYEHQLKAIDNLRSGSILCGGVGTGKTLTALGYYYLKNGGDKAWLKGEDKYQYMSNPVDLYVITTAKKRDSMDWEEEMIPFLLSPDETITPYKNRVVVDSWNNIQKYQAIRNAFFIFDEDRLIGNGKWVKCFYKIAKNNHWIILSATPGDTWMDYIPVFIANGFYRSRYEFINSHVIYDPYSKYWKVERYTNEERLIRLRNLILVEMNYDKHTEPIHEYIFCDYQKEIYKRIQKERVNLNEFVCFPNSHDAFSYRIGVDIPLEDVPPVVDGLDYIPKDGDSITILNKPIESPSQLCHALRKTINSDPSRVSKLLDIFVKHPKMIIFYNFNYELEILLRIFDGLDVKVAQYNGHKHEPIPDESYKKWIYLVQYTAGAEGWNCITTNCIVFYSQNYSWKIMAQAYGRIDRLNTPFTKLYYYHLISKAPIDLAIRRSLEEKKKFNETRWVRKSCSSAS